MNPIKLYGVVLLVMIGLSYAYYDVKALVELAQGKWTPCWLCDGTTRDQKP